VPVRDVPGRPRFSGEIVALDRIDHPEAVAESVRALEVAELAG